MSYQLRFDEINALSTYIRSIKMEYGTLKKVSKSDFDDIILDFLIMQYVYGVRAVNDMLGTEIEPSQEQMREVIYQKYDGKDFSDLINEYLDTEDVEGIVRVIETSAHHAYNGGAYDTAVSAGATKKTWVCQFRNSRDTHIYLHGMTVPIDAEFYTFMGNHAQWPGQFGVAEEDVNCQCELTFGK